MLTISPSALVAIESGPSSEGARDFAKGYDPPVPASVPHLRALIDGRFEISCGRCTEISQSVTAVDAPSAWSLLVAMGWSLYVSEKSVRSYALCHRCSVTPWSFDQAADRATKPRQPR
jgi:hypothetical protein